MSVEFQELCYLSATQLASGIRTKELSAIEVCEALLERIEQFNPQLNAYCTLTADLALTAAREAESAIMRGDDVGALHGVPFSLNDLTPTQGIRTTFGSKIYEHFIPGEDAIVVERLQNAGGILLGKTNTSEFGCKGLTDNRIFGRTYNPWDLTRSPGGSSGGAAAAVAAGLSPLAEGCDDAGSIRMPASFCGMVGFKPSQGRIPRYPHHHAWNTLRDHGPIVRCVADAALMLQVMAGPDVRDPLSLPETGEDFCSVVGGPLRLKGLRMAWTPDLGGLAPVDAEVQRLCANAVRKFADLGCELEDASPDYTGVHELFAILNANVSMATIGPYVETWSEHMDPLLLWQIEQGRSLSLSDVGMAENARTELYHRVRSFFDMYDLLVLPTIGTLPYWADQGYPEAVAGRQIATPYELLVLTYVFNLTGQPAISVPAGWTPDGLPVGLQIVGPHRADALVLHAAAAFEAVSPWSYRQPPIDVGPGQLAPPHG